MVTSKKKNVIEVDLDGEQGNVFYLLGLGRKLAKQVEMDSDEFSKEMKSGKSYSHVLKTLNDTFGSIILFRTNNKEYLKILK